jgi:Transglutaminase-like superfamily
MPPAGMLRYRVQFYYTIDRTSEAYWKEEGKFWSKDVEKFLDRKAGVDEAVAKIVQPSDIPEQKVRKIYAFVTELENQSYRPKREEQEEKVIGLKPNEGVEDVLRQRSGDHDDLNRLLVAMARAAGIPAFMMWVASRDETFFQPELMSTHQLAAEIAVVQLDGKDVFLDPGTKFCPYGLLDWRYSYSKGLRQTPSKGTEITESPMPDYSRAQILRLARVQLTDDGKIEGTIKVGFYGLEAMDRRQRANLTDVEGRKKMLEDEIRSWLPGNSDVSLVGTPNWDETEPHLATEFQISSPIALGAGKRLLVPVHIFQVNDKPVFSSSTRVNPIYFWYQTRRLDEVHITYPASLEVESLPKNDSIKLDYAVYSTMQKQESANSIMARRDVVMGGLAFPTNMYKELKDFYDKVKVGDDEQMILKGSAHAEVK